SRPTRSRRPPPLVVLTLDRGRAPAPETVQSGRFRGNGQLQRRGGTGACRSWCCGAGSCCREGEYVGVVDDPVDHGRDGVVAEHVAPAGEGQVALRISEACSYLVETSWKNRLAASCSKGCSRPRRR